MTIFNRIPAYNGLDQFSSAHKIMVRFYIAYLFLIPGISMFAHEQYFGEAEGWTYFAGLFIMFVQIGFVTNNLYVPSTTFLTLVMIIRIPLEVIVIGLIQGWDPGMMLTSLYAFEIIGWSFGLTVGTIFRNAPISAAHRLVSFLIASLFTFIAVMRFEGLFSELFLAQAWWMGGISILVPVITATIPYARTFIQGQDGQGLNMGTSLLLSRVGKYIGLAFVIDLTLMIIGINLK